MIVELLFKPFTVFISGIIGTIPVTFSLPSWGASTISLLTKGLSFFPLDLWGVIIANITFWLVAQMAWAIVEWLYKKLPGVS